jgi:hypothetical protein
MQLIGYYKHDPKGGNNLKISFKKLIFIEQQNLVKPRL